MTGWMSVVPYLQDKQWCGILVWARDSVRKRALATLCICETLAFQCLVMCAAGRAVAQLCPLLRSAHGGGATFSTSGAARAVLQACAEPSCMRPSGAYGTCRCAGLAWVMRLLCSGGHSDAAFK